MLNISILNFFLLLLKFKTESNFSTVEPQLRMVSRQHFAVEHRVGCGRPALGDRPANFHRVREDHPPLVERVGVGAATEPRLRCCHFVDVSVGFVFERVGT